MGRAAPRAGGCGEGDRGRDDGGRADGAPCRAPLRAHRGAHGLPQRGVRQAAHHRARGHRRARAARPGPRLSALLPRARRPSHCRGGPGPAPRLPARAVGARDSCPGGRAHRGAAFGGGGESSGRPPRCAGSRLPPPSARLPGALSAARWAVGLWCAGAADAPHGG